jgi:hypothetical protein
MLIALAALAYGGWKAWPWWSPVAAAALLVPGTLLKTYMVNGWRVQVGLGSITASDLAVWFVINLGILFAVFALARGLRLFIQRQRARTSEGPTA